MIPVTRTQHIKPVHVLFCVRDWCLRFTMPLFSSSPIDDHHSHKHDVEANSYHVHFKAFLRLDRY